jgi:ABC-type molybdate transport system substrate-binding protein
MPRVAQRVVDAAALLTILAALVEALLGTPADAAEIRVLSAAAMQSVLKQVTGGFERNSGHRLISITARWVPSISACWAARRRT